MHTVPFRSVVLIVAIEAKVRNGECGYQIQYQEYNGTLTATATEKHQSIRTSVTTVVRGDGPIVVVVGERVVPSTRMSGPRISGTRVSSGGHVVVFVVVFVSLVLPPQQLPLLSAMVGGGGGEWRLLIEDKIPFDGVRCRRCHLLRYCR